MLNTIFLLTNVTGNMKTCYSDLTDRHNLERQEVMEHSKQRKFDELIKCFYGLAI